jgi:hypothetical protein
MKLTPMVILLNLVLFVLSRYVNNPAGYPIGDELRRPINLDGIDRRAKFQKGDDMRKENYFKSNIKSLNNAQRLLEINTKTSTSKAFNNNRKVNIDNSGNKQR